MRNVRYVALMDELTMLCNKFHHECMYVITDGLIMEVWVHLTSMVDFDWLDVRVGSASMSVLACALLAKIMFLARPNIAGCDLCLLW